MYAVIVNGKFLGKEEKIAEAFTPFLETLKVPWYEDRLEEYSQMLQTNQMCMTRDGMIIALGEVKKSGS